MDAVGAKFTAFLKPENVVPYPDEYVGSADLHPMQFVGRGDQAASLGQGNRLASRRDDYYYTAKWDALLKQACPTANSSTRSCWSIAAA